ncbi:kinase-like domain-containing protein [Cunninghamella echinulata]|nr:kinase-like domain-containing protein [Cunninghamella echinulata]
MSTMQTSISPNKINATGQVSLSRHKSLNDLLLSATGKHRQRRANNAKSSATTLLNSSDNSSSINNCQQQHQQNRQEDHSAPVTRTRKNSLHQFISRCTSFLSAKNTAEPTLQFSTCQEDYRFLTLIGSGASAKVYSAIYQPTQTMVAVKKMDLEILDVESNDRLDILHREVQIMSLCHHPHLLPIYQSFVSSTNLYLITPIMSGGSCLDLLSQYHKNGLSEPLVACILKQLLESLKYLHDENDLIHRDIKSANLLIDFDTGIIKLADFGVSGKLISLPEIQSTTHNNTTSSTLQVPSTHHHHAYHQDIKKKSRQSFVGSPCWLSPEILLQQGYDTKVDIWSLGITGLELACGHPPYYDAKDPLTIFEYILHSPPPTLNDNTSHHQQRQQQINNCRFSTSFHDFITKCLQKNPHHRWSAQEALLHPWIQNAPSPQYLADHLKTHCPRLDIRPGLSTNNMLNATYQRPSHPLLSTFGEDSWNFSVDDDLPLKLTIPKQQHQSKNQNMSNDIDITLNGSPITPQDNHSSSSTFIPYYQLTKIGHEMRVIS